jgi:squalene-hopene/tetraprenyl-beta-curcumene cyclase
MKKEVARRVLATALGAVVVIGVAYSGFANGKASEEHAAWRFSSSDNTTANSWNARGAATYLDERESWWMGWEDAKRENGTFCVSCHTAVPYALARPTLRKTLGETSPTENERALFENVTKRVRMWDQIAPTYSDKDAGANKSAESRATEAVLLAFVLANRDAQSGKLNAETRAAFSHLWALQQADGVQKGAWLWQLFDLNPWEGNISPYNGATMAAIAVGAAPENYRSSPEIQTNLALLRDYLNRESSSQPLLNRVMLLWASAKWPGLLTADRQKEIIAEILKAQQADGGWSLFPLAKTWKDWSPASLAGKWERNDGSPQDTNSDGYATGLAVFVLKQAGVSHENSQLQRGREWLIKNQVGANGSWRTYSLNKRRDPASNAGKFMSDAATAYAVLALAD